MRPEQAGFMPGCNAMESITLAHELNATSIRVFQEGLTRYGATWCSAPYLTASIRSYGMALSLGDLSPIEGFARATLSRPACSLSAWKRGAYLTASIRSSGRQGEHYAIFYPF
ncbi:hypothetical protein QQ045_013036 [Rhodiola kirilowii]